jgi:hypothetical protein
MALVQNVDASLIPHCRRSVIVAIVALKKYLNAWQMAHKRDFVMHHDASTEMHRVL